jgi:hypothetical protein
MDRTIRRLIAAVNEGNPISKEANAIAVFGTTKLSAATVYRGTTSMKPCLPLMALAACVLACAARADDPLQNWFNDPFFQISSGIKDCAVPAGPFTDLADRRVQMHRRLEKGTTCYLAGECERPSAFAYDADIAAAFQDAVRERQPFADTTLWVTVQGRVLYLEGCVARAAQAQEIEAFARSIPHVQQATAIVRSDAGQRPPYRLRSPP